MTSATSASTITVPDTSFLTGLYPQEYIQLSNGSLARRGGDGNAYIRAGIESCVVARSFGYHLHAPAAGSSFVEAFNNSLNCPYFRHYSNLSGVNQGDGVNFSIYYDEAGNELQLRDHAAVHVRAGGVLQDAAPTGRSSSTPTAVDDFTNSTGRADRAAAVHPGSFRINQFLQGAITTEHGLRGSFVGPWTTSSDHRHQQRPAAAVWDDPGVAEPAVVGRPAGQRRGSPVATRSGSGGADSAVQA